MTEPPAARGTGSEAPWAAEFCAFFEAHYRLVAASAMYVGATRDEADEAAQKAMEEVYRRWPYIENRLPYARRVAVRYFFREGERGLDRVRGRMAGLAEGRLEGQADRELTVWEDQQWVRQLLESLPPVQRAVMALVVDEFTPTQVAEMLGKTPAAIRQTLHSARKHLKGKLREEDSEA